MAAAQEFSTTIEVTEHDILNNASNVMHVGLERIEVIKHRIVKYEKLEILEQDFLLSQEFSINFSTEPSRSQKYVSNETFLEYLTLIGDDIDSSGDTKNQFTSNLIRGTSISTTLGVFAWALRSGPMFASLMTSMPLWNTIDPVRILISNRKDDEADDDKDEDQVESLFK